MSKDMHHFVVTKCDSLDDILTVAIIITDINSRRGRYNFIYKFRKVCQEVFGDTVLDDIEIVDSPFYNETPPYMNDKIEYLLENHFSFDLHIRVGNKGTHKLNIQSTTFC